MLRTAVSIAIVLAASTAFAAPIAPLPRRAHLTYTAPNACPVEQVLRDLIAGQTASNVLPPDASARLTVAVSRLGSRYQATAELREPAGRVIWTRPFEPESSCSDLVQEVALVVSATFDPRAHGKQRAPRIDVESPTAAPEGVQGQIVPVEAAPLVVRFGVGAVLGLGVAPRLAVGMSADAGILWPVEWGPIEGLSLAVGGRWDPPAAGQVSWAPAGVRVSTSRALATVTPCGHWWKL